MTDTDGRPGWGGGGGGGGPRAALNDPPPPAAPSPPGLAHPWFFALPTILPAQAFVRTSVVFRWAFGAPVQSTGEHFPSFFSFVRFSATQTSKVLSMAPRGACLCLCYRKKTGPNRTVFALQILLFVERNNSGRTALRPHWGAAMRKRQHSMDGSRETCKSLVVGGGIGAPAAASRYSGAAADARRERAWCSRGRGGSAAMTPAATPADDTRKAGHL